MKPTVIWLCEDTGVSYRCVATERGLIFEAGDGADALGQLRWREVDNGDGRWREIAYRLAGSMQQSGEGPFRTRGPARLGDGPEATERCVICDEQYCDGLDAFGNPIHTKECRP